MLRYKELLPLFSRTLSSWSEDNAFRLSAALAFYTIFSLAPVLILAIAIAGAIFGEQAARGQVMMRIEGLIGPGGALAVQELLASARQSGVVNAASIAGLATLLIGASGAFVALQDGLNTIWRVRQKPGTFVMSIIRQRLYTFLLVLGVGLLLFGSLVATAALAIIGEFAGGTQGPAWVWQLVNTGVSFAIVTFLFGVVYEFVPDVDLNWRDVWIGAAFTAALFTAGKHAIAAYLGRSTMTSVYGAAGALVVTLMWVYYSSLIMFFGAEFTRVYAEYRGRPVIPRRGAILMTAEDTLEQGLETRHTLRKTA